MKKAQEQISEIIQTSFKNIHEILLPSALRNLGWHDLKVTLDPPSKDEAIRRLDFKIKRVEARIKDLEVKKAKNLLLRALCHMEQGHFEDADRDLNSGKHLPMPKGIRRSDFSLFLGLVKCVFEDYEEAKVNLNDFFSDEKPSLVLDPINVKPFIKHLVEKWLETVKKNDDRMKLFLLLVKNEPNSKKFYNQLIRFHKIIRKSEEAERAYALWDRVPRNMYDHNLIMLLEEVEEILYTIKQEHMGECF